MLHRWLVSGAFVLVVAHDRPKEPAARAWPHRAILQSINDGRPIAFQALTLGGDLIIAVDRSGNMIANPSGMSLVRPLTARDTIDAQTPGDFPLDLSKGAVVFIARDSLRLTVGRNPNGSVDQVTATGRSFTVRLVDDRFIIDSK